MINNSRYIVRPYIAATSSGSTSSSILKDLVENSPTLTKHAVYYGIHESSGVQGFIAIIRKGDKEYSAAIMFDYIKVQFQVYKNDQYYTTTLATL